MNDSAHHSLIRVLDQVDQLASDAIVLEELPKGLLIHAVKYLIIVSKVYIQW